MTAVLTAPAVVALFRDPQSAADLADPLASASSTLACRSKPMTCFRPGIASSSIGSSRCAKKRAMEKMPARWPPSSAPVAHEDHPQRRAMTQEQKVIRVKVGVLELARFTLNGGTALNLFFFDVPRLSVDADLNYIGAQDRATMMAEREQVERASRAVFTREDFRFSVFPHRTNTRAANGGCDIAAQLAAKATSRSISISCFEFRYGHPKPPTRAPQVSPRPGRFLCSTSMNWPQANWRRCSRVEPAETCSTLANCSGETI